MYLQHSRTISGKGSEPHQFQVRLTGVAVDGNDRLWAVGDREVKCFSAHGQLQASFETQDAGWSIAVTEKSVWVGMQGRIDQYDLQGQLLLKIVDHERLGRCTALAVSDSAMLAADATNRTIHLFEKGQWRREVGREANTRGFMLPNGVLDLTWDPQGQSFLVAHPQKHRVERYSIAGDFASKFGRFGMDDPADFGGCCNPTNITATASGRIAVSEKAPPRVKVLEADGRFVAQTTDDVFDANAKNIDLAADSQGRLYAADSQQCTIAVLQLDAPPVGGEPQ